MKITKRQVAKALREAAKLVDKGWTKGAMVVRGGPNGEPEFCATGAVRMATNGSVWNGGGVAFANLDPLGADANAFAGIGIANQNGQR